VSTVTDADAAEGVAVNSRNGQDVTLPDCFAGETISTRNGQDSGAPDAKARELWKFACRCTKNAEVCADCRKPLPPDSVVCLLHYRYRWYSSFRGWFTRKVLAPVCVACKQAAVKDGSRTQLGPCVGCGRFVLHVVGDRGLHRVLACSVRCRRAYYNARRVVPGSRDKQCVVCGTSFTSSRTDARTCSRACRQKAYRQRVRSKKTGKSCPDATASPAAASTPRGAENGREER
jgi:hypothetical protein